MNTQGFERDGWTIVSNVLTTVQVEALLRACANLCSLPEQERVHRDKPHAGTHHLADLDKRVELVDALLASRPMIDVVEQIVGSDHELLQASFRSPQPGFGSQQLHVDDLPKLDNGPDRVATAIVALVDFTVENGATRIVPGSHRRPDLQARAGKLEHHADELTVKMDAGSALVFSGHLLHSGTTNQSSQERPALQLIWQRVSPLGHA